MENEKIEKLQIYSYSKIWNLKNSIYRIGNYNLPVPVQPYNLLYFIAALAFVTFLGNIIPAFTYMPFFLRWFAFPYGITVFLRKKKLDGKNPIKYFITYLKHEFLERTMYFEYFKGFPDRARIIRVKWICSVKYHRR